MRDQDEIDGDFVEAMMRSIMQPQRKIKMELTQQKRDDLRSLLEQHQRVTDALFNHGKSSFVTTITVVDEKNGDFTEVEIHASVAKTALLAHKDWVDAELKKLGVEVGKK